tara:strand:+ start:557 stop:736 length:180 start_codon:yes stop_codon:yes gene_type:complete
MFRLCVRQLGISPSEAWKLDIIDINQLVNNENKEEIDTSIMLNYQRQLNGASKEWLLKN